MRFPGEEIDISVLRGGEALELSVPVQPVSKYFSQPAYLSPALSLTHSTEALDLSAR